MVNSKNLPWYENPSFNHINHECQHDFSITGKLPTSFFNVDETEARERGAIDFAHWFFPLRGGGGAVGGMLGAFKQDAGRSEEIEVISKFWIVNVISN